MNDRMEGQNVEGVGEVWDCSGFLPVRGVVDIDSNW